MKTFRRLRNPRYLTVALVMLCLILSGTGVVLAASTIGGRVMGPAGVTPVPNATVIFYNLLTGLTTRSSPTTVTGEFAVPALEQGRYDVAVKTDRGLWMVERPLEIGGGETRRMSFALRESTYWENTGQQPPRTSPIGDNIIGTAVVLEQERDIPGRWPKERRRKLALGTSIGGGVLGLALVFGNGDDGASPFTP